MYNIVIMSKEGDILLTLRTEKRQLARATLLICQGNELDCQVTKETKPVLVKFKGIGGEAVKPAPVEAKPAPVKSKSNK